MQCLAKPEFCAMQVLVCAATDAEIAPLIKALAKAKNDSVEFLITGVGMMATTYSLVKQLSRQKPSLILQAGVAGTFERARPLAEVVAVRSESVGDLGVVEESGFRSLFDLHLLNTNSAPWKQERLVNEFSLLSTLNYRTVDGVTVNQISTSEEMIRYYSEELGVQTESMEGAALHYVALQEKIPFLQLRSLSNFVGERNKAAWKMAEAVANLNNAVQQVLTNFDVI